MLQWPLADPTTTAKPGSISLIQQKQPYSGTVIAPEKVTAMFYLHSGGRTAFMDLELSIKYPEGRKLKIQGVVTPELLANPDLYDSEGQPYLIIGKDGTKTGPTLDCWKLAPRARLTDVMVTTEIANSTQTAVNTCSSLYFQHGRYAGMVSFLCNEPGVESIELGIYNWGKNAGVFLKGGLTITYATPGWWLLQCIKAKFPHAVFDCAVSVRTTLLAFCSPSLRSFSFYDSFCFLGARLSIGWFLVQTDALIVGWL